MLWGLFTKVTLHFPLSQMSASWFSLEKMQRNCEVRHWTLTYRGALRWNGKTNQVKISKRQELSSALWVWFGHQRITSGLKDSSVVSHLILNLWFTVSILFGSKLLVFVFTLTSVIKRVNLTSFPSMPLNFHKKMVFFNTIIPIDSLVFAMVISC